MCAQSDGGKWLCSCRTLCRREEVANTGRKRPRRQLLRFISEMESSAGKPLLCPCWAPGKRAWWPLPHQTPLCGYVEILKHLFACPCQKESRFLLWESKPAGLGWIGVADVIQWWVCCAPRVVSGKPALGSLVSHGKLCDRGSWLLTSSVGAAWGGRGHSVIPPLGPAAITVEGCALSSCSLCLSCSDRGA